MNGQCKHGNPTATCCQCLTEKFRAFEMAGQRQRAERLAAIGAISTYESKTLGRVTIPE